MSPELRKELALAEAKKQMTKGIDPAKERVAVVMPFEAAWIDPSDTDLESINDFAADRKGSVHVFYVKDVLGKSAVAELEEAKESKSKK